MKKFIILMAIVAISVGAYSYFQSQKQFGEITYRYRLTVEIDTPDGVKSGSSVIEVKRQVWPKWTSHMGKDGRSVPRGQAIFVDLGNDKHVVALLAHGRYVQASLPRDLAARAFFPQKKFYSSDTTTKARQMAQWTGKKMTLPLILTPTLAIFDDLNDPESIHIIHAMTPDEKNPDLFDEVEHYLGQGYRFKSTTIELTNDPVTDKMTQHIPWIHNFSSCKKASVKIGTAPNSKRVGSPQSLFKRKATQW